MYDLGYFVEKITDSIYSYFIWIFSSIWRKKVIFLSAVLITIIIIICLQFNASKDLDDKYPSTNAYQNHEEKEIENIIEGKVPKVIPVPLIRNHVKINDIIHEYASNKHKNTQLPNSLPYVPKNRLVHFDMKGAPPKKEYLFDLLPQLKKLGATGILLEWEDMFPWSDNLKVLAAKNAYSRSDVLELVKIAAELDLSVIPIVQTFGHLEFALKYEQFMNLREVPESPQALCPSLNQSVDLVEEMIDQIMKIHTSSEFIHIGCDEVFHLAECSRCRDKMRDELFLMHVTRVAEYVRNKWHVVPIIWDDMLRHFPLYTLESSNIGRLVEPMVWVYAEDVYRFVTQSAWDRYQIIFPTVWTASAFKGAFGETLFVPNVKRHLDNNLNWLALMAAEDKKFEQGFRGIAITGWQRYDHFATLCELLPASIPSLFVNLVVVTHGYANDSLKTSLDEALKCGVVSSVGPAAFNNHRTSLYSSETQYQPSFLNLDTDRFLWHRYAYCTFPGNTFYRVLYRWYSLRKDVNDFLTSVKEKRAWMTEYNIRRNYTLRLRVDEIMQDYGRIYHSVLGMVQLVNDALGSVFDMYTVSEWVEQNLYPSIIELEKIHNMSQSLIARNIWPQRPLQPLKDLKRLGVTSKVKDHRASDDYI